MRCHQAGAGCTLALLPAGVYLAPGAALSDGGDYKQQQKRRMSKDLGLRPLVVVVVAESAVQSSLLRPVQPCLHQLCNTRIPPPGSDAICWLAHQLLYWKTMMAVGKHSLKALLLVVSNPIHVSTYLA